MEGEGQAVQAGMAPAEGASQVVHEEGPVIRDARGPLFGEKVYSEAELSGEEAEAAKGPEGKPGEPGAATPPPAGQEGKTEAQQKAEEAPKPAEAAKPAEGKTDEKVVPIAALHEERQRRQGLSAEVIALRSRVSELEAAKTGEPTAGAAPTGPLPGEPQLPEHLKEFKGLTKEEYDKLADDDYGAALRYLRDKADYDAHGKAVSDYRAASQQRARVARDAATRTAGVIQERRAEMEEAVPGLFSDDSDVNDRLSDHALSLGFTEDQLALLSDPGARITTADGKQTFLNGRGAVNFIKALNASYQASVNGRKALETEVTERITQEFIKKFNIPASQFASIGDGQRSATDAIPLQDTGQPLTEKDFREMRGTDKERAYLGG